MLHLAGIPASASLLACDLVKAGLVEDAGEELEADDGVDDDDEHDEQHDVEQRDQGH